MVLICQWLGIGAEGDTADVESIEFNDDDPGVPAILMVLGEWQ